MDVTMPDGTIIKDVPEGATQSDLQRRLSAHQASPQAAPKQSGFQLHAPGPIGLALDLGISGARNLGAQVLGGYRGLLQSENLAKNNYKATEAVQSGQALGREPFTAEGRAVSKLMNYPFEGWAQGADWAGGGASELASGAGASPEVAGAIGSTINTGIQAIPLFVGRKVGTSSISRAAESGPRPGAAAASAERPAGLGAVPPTIEELKVQSQAAYKAAKDANVNIAPESFTNLKNRVNVILKGEGLNKTLHPMTTAALKEINATKGVVPLNDLETLRKIANDAKGAPGADGQKASVLIDEIDDYIGNLGGKDVTSGDPKAAQILGDARNLWSRKAKAEEINHLIERAKLSAPNFSASGMENALRTEFRALAKNKNRMRRFTKEEQAAIKKVAVGGPLENTLRFLGKFSPQGALSTAISGSVGFGLGGPVGAVALPAAGFASRVAATRMTKANALRAEEAMRRGPPRKPVRKPAPVEVTETP